VIRHGATEWSRTGRHTGTTDLPLLPEGETEARGLRASLPRLAPPCSPVLILTSPLLRARQTCDLAGYGTRAVVEPCLAEWDYGDYEGLTTAEIRAARPGWDLFRDGCPGGEAAGDVGCRVDRLLDRLRADPGLGGAEVLLFSHGHLLRVLTARWLGFAPAEARHFALQAGSIGRLSWEHEWAIVERWNA
jgi:broad specificity phosphatase PhoE